MSDDLPPTSDSDLDRIVDDATPHEESLVWAVAQLRAERGFDEVLAALQETGWSAEEAAEIVEQARQRTRADRGTVTREQVARTMNSHYRKGMGGGMFAGAPSLAALRRLLYSIAALLALRRPKQ